MNEENITPQATGATGQSGSNKKLWYIVGAIVLLLIIGWAASGGLARNAAERALQDAGIDADFDRDGTATFTNDEGTVTVGSNASYPDAWPSDAPKYPSGEVLFSGSTNESDGGANSSLTLTTKDSPTAVIDFFKRELASDGWTIESTADAGGAKILSAKKGERTFGVWAVGDGEATQVTIGIEQ